MREIKEEKKRAYGVGGPTQKEVVPVNLGLLDAVKKIIANSPDINYDITGMTPVYEKDTGVPIAQKDVPPTVQPTVAQKGVGDKTVPTEPVTAQTPQVTQPQSAAPVGGAPAPQSKEGELPWKQMTHGGNKMDYRITEKGQMTPEQTSQANFRDKSKGKSDALLEARGIGGGEDTSIEGIAKMILYDNTLLPAQKASALAKLRSIEAGPNAAVQAAQIGADASVKNTQALIDQQISLGKMDRDFGDPHTKYKAIDLLSTITNPDGTVTKDLEFGMKKFDEYEKKVLGKSLDPQEEELLANYTNKKAIKSFDAAYGEGAAARVIRLYLTDYLRKEKEKTK